MGIKIIQGPPVFKVLKPNIPLISMGKYNERCMRQRAAIKEIQKHIHRVIDQKVEYSTLSFWSRVMLFYYRAKLKVQSWYKEIV